MRILFVSSGNNKFGISPIVYNQGESLRKHGIEIDYYAIKGKGFFGYLKNIPKIRKSIKNGNYDLIHAHYGITGIVALFVRTSQKIIVSFMGDDLIGSVGKSGKYTTISKLSSYLNKFFSKYCYDYIIVKSQTLYNKLGINEKTIVIPNGVNIEEFYPIAKDIAKEKINLNKNLRYIIFISNPNRPEKNYKLAVQAYNNLRLFDVKLLTVYDVSHSLLNYYYNAAECLLLTSYHEGSPNVIKEAMACNCPVVSTDVGDVRWLFGNEPGHFITTFDPQDVAEKIKDALDFSKKYGRSSGRKRIIELGLDVDTVAKKVINVYQFVLTNQKR